MMKWNPYELPKIEWCNALLNANGSVANRRKSFAKTAECTSGTPKKSLIDSVVEEKPMVSYHLSDW